MIILLFNKYVTAETKMKLDLLCYLKGEQSIEYLKSKIRMKTQYKKYEISISTVQYL